MMKVSGAGEQNTSWCGLYWYGCDISFEKKSIFRLMKKDIFFIFLLLSSNLLAESTSSEA